MQHVKVTFELNPEADGDILVAMLSGIGYSGFEETASALLAYIPEDEFEQDELQGIADQLVTTFSKEIIPAQNWNALWESNFQPVVVADFCTIRAHFHDISVTTPYEIIITPKMSFGTGHHATTQLMITMMKDMVFEGKSVLDFGTGTGVLAIMAEMLGAASVLAIDNDTWCVENAAENVERNNCKNITVKIGSLEDAGIDKVDILLANINRHILLHYMLSLFDSVKDGGNLLLSGLLIDDEAVIKGAAEDAGFRFVKTMEQGGWIAILFNKS